MIVNIINSINMHGGKLIDKASWLHLIKQARYSYPTWRVIARNKAVVLNWLGC